MSWVLGSARPESGSRLAEVCDRHRTARSASVLPFSFDHGDRVQLGSINQQFHSTAGIMFERRT